MIKLLVSMGGDVADPEFVPADVELPDFGSLGLHMLGWPDQIVKPQYEQQMQRAMRQHAELRAHPDRSEEWFRDAAAGLAAFLREGKLPENERVRMFALTIGEMYAIQAHYFGRGDEDLLAAYETVATSTGPVLEAALLHLGKLQARATEARR